MKSRRFFILLSLMALLIGCSAHNPMIVQSKTSTKPVSKSHYPPHSQKVYVTTENLSDAIEYEVIAELEVGKVWYGSSKNVIQSLADGAREVGADAVVQVKTWHQPSGWSWAAPHGSGKAIKIIVPDSVDFSDLKGEWK